MKIAVINFSGNVGKTTVSKYLLSPRMEGAKLYSIETLNADEGADETAKGKDFVLFQENLMMEDSAIVDIGSSNVEEFIKRMRQARGSHEDYDLFVVPVVQETKQIKDTVQTLVCLNEIGIEADKIKIVFNRIEVGEKVRDLFSSFIHHCECNELCQPDEKAVIIENAVYQALRLNGIQFEDLMKNDQRYYKQKLAEAKLANDNEMKKRLVTTISMRRLAADAMENLDNVFNVIINQGIENERY